MGEFVLRIFSATDRVYIIYHLYHLMQTFFSNIIVLLIDLVTTIIAKPFNFISVKIIFVSKFFYIATKNINEIIRYKVYLIIVHPVMYKLFFFAIRQISFTERANNKIMVYFFDIFYKFNHFLLVKFNHKNYIAHKVIKMVNFFYKAVAINIIIIIELVITKSELT